MTCAVIIRRTHESQSHKARLRIFTKSEFALRAPKPQNERSCLESWGAFRMQSSGIVEHVTSLPEELSRSRRLQAFEPEEPSPK